MAEQADKAKGTIKEKVGQVTDDKDLEREGKLDKAGADVKEKVGRRRQTRSRTSSTAGTTRATETGSDRSS